MAHSLRSRSPDIKIRQDLKNGATVVCHKNSVFGVKADVLVISQNGSIEGMVRQKVGGSEWDRKKRYASPYIVFDWKFQSISTFDSKADFNYSKVYVVEVPAFNYRNPKKWFEEYQKMIKKLLTEAAKDHKTSITIPLLGTNAGGAPKDECIGRVMDAIFTFTKSTTLQKINIVVQDWPEFTLVQDLFEKHEKPKPKTSDEDKKFKNLADNKKKSHLMPSLNIHRTDKSNSGNRFHGLSHSNDNRKVDTSRGDNPESRHRCNSCDSRKRRSPESSTTSDDNSGKRPSRPSSTSEKQRPSNARDGGEIQNNLGFGINGSYSQRDHDKVRAEGSSVDPSSHHHSTRHGNHSEHNMRGDTQDKVAKLPTNVWQEDSHGNIRKTDLNHTKSYADMVKKNPKEDSDHNNYSNGNSFKSYNEDVGFSKEYANSHRKPQMDSNNKKYSDDRNSISYNSCEDISKLNAEFDRARLQELEESDSSDDPDNGSMPLNKEKELKIRHHQSNNDSKSSSHNVKDTESEKIGSSGIPAIREVSMRICSYCSHYTINIVEYSCHHVFCIACAPTDQSCCDNTVKELKELPCRHFCCHYCFYNRKSCQECKDERCNRDEDKSSKPSNRGQSSREHIHGDARLNTDEDKSCELGNKGQNSIERTHGDHRDITVVEECNRCKLDLKDISSIRSACGHLLCVKCLPKGCDDRSCCQEPESHRGQSSKERTQGEGRDITMVEECNRCKLDLTNKSSVRSTCGHTLCSKCLPKGCNDRFCCQESEGNRGQHSREQTHGHAGFNRDEENSSEPDNGGQSSKRETHGDERRIKDEEKHRSQSSREPTLKDDPGWRDQESRETIVKTCFKCNVNLENNSPVQLGCGHNFCARCASQGCKDPTCKEEEEEEDCDDDINLPSSRLSPDHHSNRGACKSDGNHVNTRQKNPGNSEWNGSNGNYRDSRTDNHSRGERDGSHGFSGDSNGSEIHDRESLKPKHREVDKSRKDAEPTETCAICMDDFTDPKTLEKCGHVFCRQCIENCFKLHKPVCPSCGMVYGVTIGNMPAGTMDVKRSLTNIEGFKKRTGSYSITYQFYSGTQGAEHPNPGSKFKGTTRVAYLPANPEGTKVCKMLKVAFKRRLTFTIGRSTTTGQENVVTWNDIHHKTSLIGGPTCFGYPDNTYLSRVTEELASKGVTLADIDGVKDGDDMIIVR